MFVFLDGNLAEVKRLLIPLDVQRDFEQRGGGVGLGEGVGGGRGVGWDVQADLDLLIVFKGRELDHSIQMQSFCYWYRYKRE